MAQIYANFAAPFAYVAMHSRLPDSTRFEQLCNHPTAVLVSRLEWQDRRFADILVPFSQWDSSDVHVALLGVPQDEGVRRNGGRLGAADAPTAIRAALAKLTVSIGRATLPPPALILDGGDLRADGLSLEQIHAHHQEAVTLLLGTGATVIVLGGGHDIALPNARALGAHAQRLGIINVDAHLDVRVPTAEGSHSGSAFRDVIEDPACHLARLVEFGIQPFSASAHHVQYVLERGHRVWMLDDIRRLGLDDALDAVIALVQDCDALHLSLDMDAIASAYAPGVSAPASDGFRPDEVVRIIERFAKLPQCRLIDIAEVNPRHDTDGRTARLAAYLVAHCIWSIFHRTTDANPSLCLGPSGNDQ